MSLQTLPRIAPSHTIFVILFKPDTVWDLTRLWHPSRKSSVLQHHLSEMASGRSPLLPFSTPEPQSQTHSARSDNPVPLRHPKHQYQDVAPVTHACDERLESLDFDDGSDAYAMPVTCSDLSHPVGSQNTLSEVYQTRKSYAPSSDTSATQSTSGETVTLHSLSQPSASSLYEHQLSNVDIESSQSSISLDTCLSARSSFEIVSQKPHSDLLRHRAQLSLAGVSPQANLTEYLADEASNSNDLKTAPVLRVKLMKIKPLKTLLSKRLRLQVPKASQDSSPVQSSPREKRHEPRPSGTSYHRQPTRDIHALSTYSLEPFGGERCSSSATSMWTNRASMDGEPSALSSINPIPDCGQSSGDGIVISGSILFNKNSIARTPFSNGKSPIPSASSIRTGDDEDASSSDEEMESIIAGLQRIGPPEKAITCDRPRDSMTFENMSAFTSCSFETAYPTGTITPSDSRRSRILPDPRGSQILEGLPESHTEDSVCDDDSASIERRSSFGSIRSFDEAAVVGDFALPTWPALASTTKSPFNHTPLTSGSFRSEECSVTMRCPIVNEKRTFKPSRSNLRVV